MNKFKLLLYILIQWAWGFIQNIMGLICCAFCIKSKHFLYHGAVVTFWNKEACMGLGMFIFMSKNTISCGNVQEVLKNAHAKEILIHEYGHTIQSVILGPLFIFVIGIPSLVWAYHPYYRNKRKKENISYLTAWQECWASSLGKAVVNVLEQDKDLDY